MHRSPQKQSAAQRDRYADFDMADTQADRRAQRGNQPKAHKFPLREEDAREARRDKQFDKE
ncbi:hypothetical protein [Ramlibacter sp. WS9]|uniref:hypothetical protein n=1 Tax=Ramlibacter sp. WS9 TaxID=1882741 RepID=UPI0011432C64|nr:hypothetical protein [Ramlibacter sp. WS9]ROZ76537.1 hypothetical protein EEB15_11830 [Ramlibacter sp. WS9]